MSDIDTTKPKKKIGRPSFVAKIYFFCDFSVCIDRIIEDIKNLYGFKIKMYKNETKNTKTTNICYMIYLNSVLGNKEFNDISGYLETIIKEQSKKHTTIFYKDMLCNDINKSYHLKYSFGEMDTNIKNKVVFIEDD